MPPACVGPRAVGNSLSDKMLTLFWCALTPHGLDHNSLIKIARVIRIILPRYTVCSVFMASERAGDAPSVAENSGHLRRTESMHRFEQSNRDLQNVAVNGTLFA
eukprot:1827495-Pyramimonas_sp.AAC.1